jgi:hypothetical protein
MALWAALAACDNVTAFGFGGVCAAGSDGAGSATRAGGGARASGGSSGGGRAKAHPAEPKERRGVEADTYYAPRSHERRRSSAVRPR